MEVSEIKRQQIYALLYAPLNKYEKAEKIAKILNTPDEEIIAAETKKNTTKLKTDLEEVYRALFKKKGEINENQKSK